METAGVLHSSAHAEGAAGTLDFLWLELTQKCNLSCQHCYVSSSPDLPLHDRMTHEDWCAAISQGRALGCEAMQFIGGEPFLYPRLNDLIALAKREGYRMIEVYTNGTPVTERVAAHLAVNQVRVACSLYSDDPRIHDAVTGRIGSFEKTMAALRGLVSHDVKIRVGFIEMKENAGEFEATKRMLGGLGILDVGYDQVRDFGRGSRPADPDRSSKFGDLCGQCWRGKICITSSGDAYPCIMARAFKVGNFLDGGLGDVVGGALLRTFRNDMSAEHPRMAPCEPESQPACMVCGPGVCRPDHGYPCMPENCRPNNPCPPEGCGPQWT